jgi:hypothetical protein
MQAFLTTAAARGLGEWVGSHGTLTSLQYAQRERISTDRVLRYRAVLGDVPSWFSFSVTGPSQIAQIHGW